MDDELLRAQHLADLSPAARIHGLLRLYQDAAEEWRGRGADDQTISKAARQRVERVMALTFVLLLARRPA